MPGELEAVQRLRLKLKAARALLRDLTAACAEAERVLDQSLVAEPKEGIAHGEVEAERHRTAA